MLFRRNPRDENVDEALGGLGPCVPRDESRNAGERAQEIERVNSETDLAAGDGVIDQHRDRFLGLRTGGRIKVGRSADERVERFGHPVLGRHIVHEQEHPLAQSFHRGIFVGEVRSGGHKLFGLVTVDGLNEGIARREMAIERANSDIGGARDLLKAGA